MASSESIALIIALLFGFTPPIISYSCPDDYFKNVSSFSFLRLLLLLRSISRHYPIHFLSNLMFNSLGARFIPRRCERSLFVYFPFVFAFFNGTNLLVDSAERH